jgi:hypothetical protein
MSRNHGPAMVFRELRRLHKWSDVPAIAALTDALTAAESVTTDATRRRIDSDPA